MENELLKAIKSTIDVVSDLHLDFQKDQGKQFIEELRPGSEILVIAGDIAEFPWFSEQLHSSNLLESLCAKYKDVIFIAGNHDYYKGGFDDGDRVFRLLEEEIANFHFLEREVRTINGISFAGTTLWFRNSPINVYREKYMADFEQIELCRHFVYPRNELAIDFLKELENIDVVITHHLPAYNSINPRFEQDALQCFFFCDVEETIVTLEPKLWVHGHTHIGCDYQFFNTRVVCHPRGYYFEPKWREYQPLTVEINLRA